MKNIQKSYKILSPWYSKGDVTRTIIMHTTTKLLEPTTDHTRLGYYYFHNEITRENRNIKN